MTARRATLLLSIVLPLIACQPSGPADPATATDAATPSSPSASTHKTATTVTRWQCDKLTVATHFDDASLESITLETPERTLTLKSMANEDGARFADAAGNEFWSRPGKVSLSLLGQPAMACRKTRAAASAQR
ncbi:MliC family protein [Lysobacter solisilvae (ex Woo and Kim 2020)]|uniref:MliC family protein n=1 Tax=Agrilutibacter terrestris TaxID=2865112 RepID=A0A7H0FY00_9GAMM|nr:MliC family protein [Lysobacter terrestris]QNP40916.1 MliC family protein [Lysobacter terrestris]